MGPEDTRPVVVSGEGRIPGRADEEMRALEALVDQLSDAIVVATRFLPPEGLAEVSNVLSRHLRVLPAGRPPRALSRASVRDELAMLWASLERDER